MNIDPIEKAAKSTRNKTRRVAAGARKESVSRAARNGADVVVAIDRAQRTVSDLSARAQRTAAEFGDRAYSGGRQAVVRVAHEIENRPWTVAALMGGAVLAGLSFYMLASSRRR
jgi:hypothetical protein